MSSATTSKTGFDVRYRTIDLVTITTLGVAFGVIFWGWGKALRAAQRPGRLRLSAQRRRCSAASG